MNTIEVCVHLIAVLCSGATLQSRGPSLVGLFSAHPFRSWYPTMHLWCPEDFWVSGSCCFLNAQKSDRVTLDVNSVDSFGSVAFIYSSSLTGHILSWWFSLVFGAELFPEMPSFGAVERLYLLETITCNDHMHVFRWCPSSWTVCVWTRQEAVLTGGRWRFTLVPTAVTMMGSTALSSSGSRTSAQINTHKLKPHNVCAPLDKRPSRGDVS